MCKFKDLKMNGAVKNDEWDVCANSQPIADLGGSSKYSIEIFEN